MAVCVWGGENGAWVLSGVTSICWQSGEKLTGCLQMKMSWILLCICGVSVMRVTDHCWAGKPWQLQDQHFLAVENTHTHTHIYTHIYTHTYIHTYTQITSHLLTRKQSEEGGICKFISSYTHIHTHTSVYTHAHVKERIERKREEEWQEGGDFRVCVSEGKGWRRKRKGWCCTFS